MLVVVLGLASRRYGTALPAFVAEYAGDTLWAVMAFIVIGVLAPDWPTSRVAGAALLASYADEVSQLYHAPWIDAIRNTRLGALTLGYGFLWSDIVCYTAGVALCVVVEHLIYARRGAITVSRCASALIVTLAAVTVTAQQMPDRTFRPMIEDRAYAIGTGPVVCFDEGHGNAHALDDSFWPFGDLVRRDGYVVRTMATLDRQTMVECGVVMVASPRLRIANADEIRGRVEQGGSLLLIADRESLAAVADLTAAFGVGFSDAPAAPARFRSADNTLRPHAIVRGRHAKESAASVAVFSGLAMQAPATAEPLLAASDGTIQGLVMRVGMGRAAFFGDPTLFTAHIAGPERRLIGMSARGAEQNFQFVLNVMHWLSGVI